MMKRRLQLALAIVAVTQMILATRSDAVTVGFEDFDGGQVNLVSSSVTSLDGGNGDWFGVASIGSWPQAAGPPFSIADDSVADVSGNGIFADDTEGLFGQNRAPDDSFFALSDTREWTDPEQRTASWTFDISGFSGLELSIDMGAQANDNFGGFGPDTEVTFTYQIDGGPIRTAFTVKPNANFGTYSYRAMDIGTIPPIGDVGPLEASGDNPVTKTLADTGSPDSNTFLNKTPGAGTGAGLMDAFSTALNGTGSQLVLTMTANVPNEAMAFDNIRISGVPEPSSVALLGMGAAMCFGADRFRGRRPVAPCSCRDHGECRRSTGVRSWLRQERSTANRCRTR